MILLFWSTFNKNVSLPSKKKNKTLSRVGSQRLTQSIKCSLSSPVVRRRYGVGVWDAAAVHEGDGQLRPHHGFLSWRNPHEDAEDAHPASHHLQPHHRCVTTR